MTEFHFHEWSYLHRMMYSEYAVAHDQKRRWVLDLNKARDPINTLKYLSDEYGILKGLQLKNSQEFPFLTLTILSFFHHWRPAVEIVAYENQQALSLDSFLLKQRSSAPMAGRFFDWLSSRWPFQIFFYLLAYISCFFNALSPHRVKNKLKHQVEQSYWTARRAYWTLQSVYWFLYEMSWALRRFLGVCWVLFLRTFGKPFYFLRYQYQTRIKKRCV